MSQIHRQGTVKWAQALLFAAVLTMSQLGPAMAENKAPSLLVMGDSLSAAYGMTVEQGWVSLLASKLQQEEKSWRVVNASISGETTAGGVSRIAGELKQHSPKLVIIELGANDGLRGLPLEIAQSNLDRIIQLSKKSGASVLLIGMRIPPNYGPDYTQAFHSMYADLAKRNEVALLPFLMEPIAANRDNYLEDNLHPTVAAQPVLLAHVWTALAPMLR